MRAVRWLVVLAALAAIAVFALRRRQAPPVPGAVPQGQTDKVIGTKAVTTAPEPLPPWVNDQPRIVMEGARRVARAVGSARSGDLSLSRSRAEDLARWQLAKLLDGKESIVGSEVTVNGARVVQSYAAADGTVYVELSAPVHR